MFGTLPTQQLGMLYYMERQPLMVRCLKTLVSFMWQMGGAYDSIFMPLRGLAVPFSTKVDSQIAHKRPDLAYPLSMGNGFALP